VQEPLNGTEQTHGHCRAAAAAGIAASTLGTGTAQAASGGKKPVKELFGTLADGSKVYRWSLENGGTRLKVLSWGGVVQSLELPDRHGRYANVSLGFDNIADYEAKTPYFGALIGRYGNRIAKGQFTLDGKSYQLSVNDGVNSLHGGTQGFDKHVWDVEPLHLRLRRRPAPPTTPASTARWATRAPSR
jgi:aldose 1-epimerase